MSGADAPSPMFHAVYIDRESFAYLQEDCESRDETVAVKVLVSVGSK